MDLRSDIRRSHPRVPCTERKKQCTARSRQSENSAIGAAGVALQVFGILGWVLDFWRGLGRWCLLKDLMHSRLLVVSWRYRALGEPILAVPLPDLKRSLTDARPGSCTHLES